MSNKETKDRASLLKDFLARLDSPEDVEAIQEDFNENFAEVSVEEIAAAEELLLKQGTTVQDIGELCSLHTALLDGKIETPPQAELQTSGHPAQMFLAENQGLRDYLDQKIEPLLLDSSLQSKRDAAVEALEGLRKLRKHYDKKDMLFFPYLEKAGITGPSTVMWENEERNKTAIKRTIRLFEAGTATEEELHTALAKLNEDIRGMVKLEHEILLPMVLENVKPEEWVIIAEEALEIGYVYLEGIEGAALSDANTWLNEQKGVVTSAPASGEIVLPTGSFDLGTLRSILNTLEVDMTVLDAEDNVIYFNEMTPRYFSRTKTILGRSVYLCHPPASIPIVTQVLEDLKSRRRLSVTTYFPKGERRLLIQYFGLYDENENYIGCLEAVQDLKPLEIYFEGSSTKEPGQRRVSAEEMAGKTPYVPGAVADGATSAENATSSDSGFVLSLDTKLNELLKARPEAFDILKSMSEKYRQLDNPVMRHAMGNVATMRMIAKKGAFTEDEFINTLREKLGM